MSNEVDASWGSQDIASCLLDYCKTLPKDIEHIKTLTDSCCGKNRNENIALT